MFGEPPYANRRASLLAWRLFPHLAGRARLRLLNESWSSVLELARFELSVFPGLLSCLRLHSWMHEFFMHVYLPLHTCADACLYASSRRYCFHAQSSKVRQVQRMLCVLKVRQVQKILYLRMCAHSI